MEWDPITQMIIYLLFLLVPLIMVKFGKEGDILAGFSLSLLLFFTGFFSYLFSIEIGLYSWSLYLVLLLTFICTIYCGWCFYNVRVKNRNNKLKKSKDG